MAAVMTKRDLIRKIAQEEGLTQNQTQSVVESFLNKCLSVAQDGGSIVLQGFGTFGPGFIPAMSGERFGVAFDYPKRNRPRFKSSKSWIVEVD